MKTKIEIVNHAAIIDVGYKHHFNARELEKCIQNTVQWLQTLVKAKGMLENEKTGQQIKA